MGVLPEESRPGDSPQEAQEAKEAPYTGYQASYGQQGDSQSPPAPSGVYGPPVVSDYGQSPRVSSEGNQFPPPQADTRSASSPQEDPQQWGQAKNGHQPHQVNNSPKKPSKVQTLSITGLVFFLVAVFTFYISVLFHHQVVVGLMMLLSSGLLLASAILLVWGAFISGKKLLNNESEEKTGNIGSLVLAVTIAPIAILFGSLSLVSSLVAWVTSFF